MRVHNNLPMKSPSVLHYAVAIGDWSCQHFGEGKHTPGRGVASPAPQLRTHYLLTA